jgi:hypothetical protein
VQECASLFCPCLLESDYVVKHGKSTAGEGFLNPQNYGYVGKWLPPKLVFILNGRPIRPHSWE